MFSYSALCWWKSQAGIPPRHGFTGTQPRAVQPRPGDCYIVAICTWERPHQHQGAACLPPLFSRICSLQLPREWQRCHSVSRVTPCHTLSRVTRDSPSHLINWSAAVYTALSHNMSHCTSLPSARHTISFYLGNSRKGKTLPTTAVKLRGPIVKLNIRWLRPPGQARISLPQSPRRPGTD